MRGPLWWERAGGWQMARRNNLSVGLPSQVALPNPLHEISFASGFGAALSIRRLALIFLLFFFFLFFFLFFSPPNSTHWLVIQPRLASFVFSCLRRRIDWAP